MGYIRWAGERSRSAPGVSFLPHGRKYHACMYYFLHGAEKDAESGHGDSESSAIWCRGRSPRTTEGKGTSSIRGWSSIKAWQNHKDEDRLQLLFIQIMKASWSLLVSFALLFIGVSAEKPLDNRACTCGVYGLQPDTTYCCGKVSGLYHTRQSRCTVLKGNNQEQDFRSCCSSIKDGQSGVCSDV